MSLRSVFHDRSGPHTRKTSWQLVTDLLQAQLKKWRESMASWYGASLHNSSEISSHRHRLRENVPSSLNNKVKCVVYLKSKHREWLHEMSDRWNTCRKETRFRRERPSWSCLSGWKPSYYCWPWELNPRPPGLELHYGFRPRTGHPWPLDHRVSKRQDKRAIAGGHVGRTWNYVAISAWKGYEREDDYRIVDLRVKLLIIAIYCW